MKAQFAWYSENSNNTTHKIGEKYSNQLGLYDMSGNVSEWVWDYYSNYPSTTQTNYRGPSVATNRVLKGGDWFNNADYLQIGYRNQKSPTSTTNFYGFRVAQSY